MHTTMPHKTLLLALLALAAGLSPVSARPLTAAKIPADAKWVMHLDMERFAPSQTCRFLTEGPGASASVKASLAHYRTLLGLDPLKDLSTVTLYGNETTGNDGVALVGGALKPDRITTLMRSYPNYRAQSVNGKTLMTWRDKTSGRPLWACFNTTRELILASNQPAVMTSLGTLDGSRPSLDSSRKSGALPLPTARPGTFFTISTKGYAGQNPDPVTASILKNTEHAVIQFAEEKGTVDGQLTLLADSPDAADMIERTLKGLMLGAAFTDDSSPLAKLAELGTVSRADRTVFMKVRCPAKDAASLISTLMAGK